MNQIINSLQHPLVKHLVRLRKKRLYRYEKRTFVVEGIKIIKDLQVPIKNLLIEESKTFTGDLKAEEIIYVSSAVMKKISGTVSPEGIIAEVTMPAQASFKSSDNIVIIDNINDPGNLGTIIRTALALSWNGIFILENTVDPYNEKTLRSAKGAQIKIPMAFGSWQDLLQIIKKNNWNCFVANLSGISLNEATMQPGTALILSNESQGPSEQALAAAKSITIPISHNMESLNVAIAGGIIMYNLKNNC